MDLNIIQGSGIAIKDGINPNLYKLKLSVQISSLVKNGIYIVKFDKPNKVSVKLNINDTILNKSVLNPFFLELNENDILPNISYILIYDEDYFILYNLFDYSRLLSIVSDINGTILQTVNLFTNPIYINIPNKTYFVTDAFVQITFISLAGAPPKISIGITEGFNDIFNDTILSGLTGTKHFFHFNSGGKKRLCLAGEIIKLNIKVASTFTDYKMRVFLFANSN